MSAHVAPHRWADAFAGTLGEREVAKMELHAESCSRCAHARDRVHTASQSFPAMRAQSAPELSWDSVRARVHWSVSSDKRTKSRAGSRTPWLVGAGVLAAGGVALVVSLAGATDPAAPRPPEPTAIAPAVVVPRVEPTPLGAIVVRESGELMIDGVQRDAFSDVLGAGVTLATGAGDLDLQFDDASALSLGPRSTLEIRRLDSHHVELALVAGTLDVTVTRRASDQRFTVAFGARTVEVRGTQFQIREHDGSARVACAHGKVAVSDGAGEIEVTGAHAVELGAKAQVTSVRASELSGDELKELIEATPMTLPAWTSPAQLVATSSPLEVATSGPREVRVDGVEVGTGPLVRVRVMPGRHTIETADEAGRFRRAGWVDVAVGKTARLDVHADASTSSGGAATRRKQLRAGIDRARLSACTRAIAKAGMTDTYVKIEISIDDTGAVQFLNVIDTDLPSTTASCIRDVLSDVRFKRGPSATFRDKLDL